MAHVRCMWGPEDCRWYGINYDDRWIIKQLPNRDRTWNGARPVPTRDWCAERIARYGRCPNHKNRKPGTRVNAVDPDQLGAAA